VISLIELGHISDDTIKVGFSSAAPLNIPDLQLMHHFCTSTVLAVHNEPTIRRVWSISVPSLAFSHDFVMHGILAVAALHIAYLRPESRDLYLSQAVIHHQEGLRKATPVLSQFQKQNPSAIYAHSALTLLYTLAGSKHDNAFILGGDADIADWIVLSRQTYSLVRYSDKKLFDGPLGPVFAAGANRAKMHDQLDDEGFKVPQTEHLKQLFSRICETTADDWKREAYRHSIHELNKVFRVVYSQPWDTLEATDVYIWAYCIQDEFLTLLKEYTQEALVIMAFFAAVPQRFAANKHWLLEGFSMYLISKIYPLIDEQHLPWIEWPLREIGWNPAVDVKMQLDGSQDSEVLWENRV
jgi:hypothetical protein